MNLNEAISELEEHGYIVELFSPAPLIAATNMAMQNARKREDSTWHRPKKQHSYKEIYNILSKFYDSVDQYEDSFRVRWTCKKKGVKRADRYTYSLFTNRVGKFNKMADKYILCCTGDDLEEYLQKEKNGHIVESVNTPALVENLSEVLLEVFEFDNASQLKSTVPNAICYGLDDGEHDVVLICEYFHDRDVLRVTLNYGDFEDTFKDFSKHVDIDKDGKISHDQELEDFAYDCNKEWTDAFGY